MLAQLCLYTRSLRDDFHFYYKPDNSSWFQGEYMKEFHHNRSSGWVAREYNEGVAVMRSSEDGRKDLSGRAICNWEGVFIPDGNLAEIQANFRHIVSIVEKTLNQGPRGKALDSALDSLRSPLRQNIDLPFLTRKSATPPPVQRERTREVIAKDKSAPQAAQDTVPATTRTWGWEGKSKFRRVIDIITGNDPLSRR